MIGAEASGAGEARRARRGSPRRRSSSPSREPLLRRRTRRCHDITMDIPETAGHRLHRAVGLRQVHAAALLQPHERPDRQRADRGRDPRRRDRTSTPRTSTSIELRRRVGMVFQKSNPFPKSIYENVAYGAADRRHQRTRPRSTRPCESSLRGAALWDEVKDRLTAAGLALSGGQQQRLLHRPRDRGRARDHPDGRAVLGARPDRDPQDRGTDPASSKRRTRSSS